MESCDLAESYYRPSFFWIELATSYDFNDIWGKEIEHTFFHEYIHYLQDITTTFGYINYIHRLSLIKAMYHKIKELFANNITKLLLPINFFDDLYRDVNISLFKHYLKYESKKIVNSFQINTVNEVVEVVEGINVNTYIISFNNNESIYFGAHAILESICHILEKYLYKINSKEIILPYYLSEYVANFYSEVFINHIDYVLDLCEYSLMFYNPAEIFIYILKVLKNDKRYKPIDNEDFRQYMFSILEQNNNFKMKSLFKKNKIDLLGEINGTFTSNLYGYFKQWLITTIETGYNYKNTNNLLFSKILNYNPKHFFNETVPILGMPLTFNQEGKFYVVDVNNMHVDSAYLARALSEVYDTIIYNKRECSLMESCKFANTIKNKKIKITDYCKYAPWKNFINDRNAEICGYCQVWNTLGLSPIEIL